MMETAITCKQGFKFMPCDVTWRPLVLSARTSHHQSRPFSSTRLGIFGYPRILADPCGPYFFLSRVGNLQTRPEIARLPTHEGSRLCTVYTVSAIRIS